MFRMLQIAGKPLWNWILAISLAVAGFFAGMMLFSPRPRTISTMRVEACLEAYISHRHTGDAAKLRSELARLHLKPAEFEKIIDRFIHYRMSKSSLDQAMKLLDAFRSGYRIVPERVESPTDASEPFALDAEILTVFRTRPELVKKAFES
ncbi:MAG TPA: hypothetical protein PLU72_00955 [Candidatus Ozemobacteraceae bacterium]|nr:hypothetical protein [Candidatus Ozemobacteraceae bacterium]